MLDSYSRIPESSTRLPKIQLGVRLHWTVYVSPGGCCVLPHLAPWRDGVYVTYSVILLSLSDLSTSFSHL